MINEKTWCFSPETYALLRKKQTAEIDAWLDEHVAQETGYVLDDSLTLANAAAQAKATGDAIAAIGANLAPAFDSTATYAVGDLVLQDGAVYRFTAAHAGAWDAADVEQTTLGEEVMDLDAAKADKTDVATADAALTQMILASFPVDTITDAATASFTDGADGIPVKALTVNITPVQAAGTPTPESPLPISGWTGANIHVAKKSIQMDNSFSDVTGYYKIQTTKSRIRKDYYGTTNNGRVMTAAQVESLLSPYNNLAAGKYKFTGSISGSQTISSVTVLFVTWDGSQSVTATMNGAAVNVPEGMRIQTIDMNVMSWGAGDWIQLDDFAIVVEPSAVYAVSWQSAAGTVYGGTLTDNGDGTWTLKARPYYASYNGETLVGPWVSSMDEYAAGTTPTTGAQVVDLGGAETEYTLTAESVKTLLGANNIFADCGNVAALTYRADVGLYIDKKLAEA